MPAVFRASWRPETVRTTAVEVQLTVLIQKEVIFYGVLHYTIESEVISKESLSKHFTNNT